MGKGSKEPTLLRKLRRDAGYKNAADFARAIGAEQSLSTVRHHDNGTRPITVDWAKRYAKHLPIDWHELVGDKKAPDTEVNAQLMNQHLASTPATRNKGGAKMQQEILNQILVRLYEVEREIAALKRSVGGRAGDRGAKAFGRKLPSEGRENDEGVVVPFPGRSTEPR